MSDEDLAGLLGAYGRLRGRLQQQSTDLPVLSDVRLACPPPRLLKEQELAGAMSGFECGWIAWQSGITWFADRAQAADSVDSLGRILQAELADGDRSLHVHFDSVKQGWWAASFLENDGGDERFLVEEVKYQMEPPKAQSPGVALCYRRYWGEGRFGAMRPLHARFCGFAKGE